MMTQREITAAYHRGDDIAAIWNRRARNTAIAWAVIGTPVFLLGLYVVKSALGIDLFDFHLWDLL